MTSLVAVFYSLRLWHYCIHRFDNFDERILIQSARTSSNNANKTCNVIAIFMHSQ